MAYDTFINHWERPRPHKPENENIGQISEGRLVRDDAGKSHLLLAMVDAKEMESQSTARPFLKEFFCPVRVVRNSCTMPMSIRARSVLIS